MLLANVDAQHRGFAPPPAPAEPLLKARERLRGPDLRDGGDAPQIDPELQRCGGHSRGRQVTCLQPQLQRLAQLLGQAPVVREELLRHAVPDAALAETVGKRLNGPARAAEDEVVGASQVAVEVVGDPAERILSAVLRQLVDSVRFRRLRVSADL